MFCREQVTQLRDIVREIEAAGATLVIVGNGTPLMLEGFLEEFGQGVDVAYTDPTLAVYQALGARRTGGWFVLDPRVWWNSLRALLRGNMQRGVQGDAWQLGGTWVVQTGGEVLLEHRSRVPGDHPSHDAILDALMAA